MSAPHRSQPHSYKLSDPQLKPTEISRLSEEKLGVRPFDWQVEAARYILCGDDVILDVGTGCGKTLVFQLPLLLNKTDISLVISPLSALMIDQARSAKLPTIAVCAETMEGVGREKLYEEIAQGRYQQVLVSPEIAVTAEFRQGVLIKSEFTSRLRVVCIDEAHCINIWGGTFRPEYEELGSLRGRIPRNIPFLVASATLPDHVLADVRRKLRLTQDVRRVAVTNDRPNVALSVRMMKHDDESKGDLRFLIPQGAKALDSIPPTAVFCNSRLVTEDICDTIRAWARDEGIENAEEGIVFYHSKISPTEKRAIEEGLRNGKVRIIICTDAVGMGCDMRNLVRVVLWGLPPTFCALVQRAGRAGRDMTIDAEAILIIPASQLKKAPDAFARDVESIAVEVAASHESFNQPELEDSDGGDEEGVTVGEGRERVSLQEVGARVSADVMHEEESALQAKRKRFKKTKQDYHPSEALYLYRFIKGDEDRRHVWNDFFNNSSKIQLVYPTTTVFRPRTLQCCDVCSPDAFPVEVIAVAKKPGLKRGRKKVLHPLLQAKLRERLIRWRDNELMDMFYKTSSSSIFSMSGNALLHNDVIDKIVKSGERLTDPKLLKSHISWYLAFGPSANPDSDTPVLLEYGKALLQELQSVYEEFDKSQSSSGEIPPDQFYGASSTSQKRRSGLKDVGGVVAEEVVEAEIGVMEKEGPPRQVQLL